MVSVASTTVSKTVRSGSNPDGPAIDYKPRSVNYTLAYR